MRKLLWKKRAKKALNQSSEFLNKKWHQVKDPNPSAKPIDPADDILKKTETAIKTVTQDKHIPAVVREALAEDYEQIQMMLDKIEHGHIHISVFGRVSVGKSALLNALSGEQKFTTSPLHGMTQRAQLTVWLEYQAGGVYLIDTPGINEISGEVRERIAHEVSERSDLILFVVDGDITEIEYQALQLLSQENRPIILVLNKSDRYSKNNLALLVDNIRQRVNHLVNPDYIVTTAAFPGEKIFVEIDKQGNECETYRVPEADIRNLKALLLHIMEKEGKLLAAVNASVFAGRLSDQVGKRLRVVKRTLAEKIIRSHCIIKGVSVAANPVPYADLVAAIAVDIMMVRRLGQLYNYSLSKSEASRLIKTIGGQMMLTLGTVWGVNLISSTLKLTSFGLSTLLTASAQGVVSYYGTYVIGKATEIYFAQGKSWGAEGPKQLVQSLLTNLDKDSILQQAKKDILDKLKLR